MSPVAASQPDSAPPVRGPGVPPSPADTTIGCRGLGACGTCGPAHTCGIAALEPRWRQDHLLLWAQPRPMAPPPRVVHAAMYGVCAAVHGVGSHAWGHAQDVQLCTGCATMQGVCSQVPAQARGAQPHEGCPCCPDLACPSVCCPPARSWESGRAAGSRHPICTELQREHPQRGLPCPAPPRRPANSPSPAPFVLGLASTRAPSAHMTAQTERAIHPGLGADKAEAEEKPTRLPGSEAVDSSRPLSPSALRWAPSARGAHATPSPVPGAAERARRAPGRRAGREAASRSVEGAGSLPPAQPLARGVPAGCCGVPRWCSS